MGPSLLWALQAVTEISSSAQIFCCDSPCAETIPQSTAPCPLPQLVSPAPHLPGSLHPLPQAEVEQGDDQHQAGGELPAGAQVAEAGLSWRCSTIAPAEEGAAVPGAASPPRSRPAQRTAPPLGTAARTWPHSLGDPWPPTPERPGPSRSGDTGLPLSVKRNREIHSYSFLEFNTPFTVAGRAR